MDNELVEQTRSYSDTRILNTLSQAQNFSKESVDAARIIAVERNLISKEEGNVKGVDPQLITKAQRLLEDEVPIDKILGLFASQGIDAKDAESAIHSASKIAVVGRKKKRGSHGGYFWLYFLLFA